MGWLYLTLLSVVITAFANILQRVLMKDDKSNPYSYAIAFHLVVTVFYFAFSSINGFSLPAFSIKFLFMPLASMLWGLGTVFLFRALKLLEISEVTIIGSTRTLVTIVGSVLFLGDTFGFQKIVGTAIMFLSVFLATNLKNGIKFNKGITYSFGMAICYGLGLVFDAFNIKSFDPISYLAIGNLMISLFLLLLFPQTVKAWKEYVNPPFLKKMLPLGILSSTQAVAYYFAIKYGPTSQIASINLSLIIVTVLLAAILLKERDNLFKKIIAALLVTLGIFLLR
ncbi:MAG TPA: DMT family transporter [Patescibacteria group bacterium]|nr:DMT family transporter [Patescibacteria group bacterium]